MTTRCGACGGTGFSRGAACSTCDGAGYVDVRREINVEIPPGAPDGHEITFKGLGDEHPQRATGDLILVVTVAQHPVFSRSEAAPENLYCNASVGLLDALLGFDRKLTGLSGERLLVEHRRVAFSSFTLSIRDEGLPVFGNATQRGQVTVFIRVDFPKTLTALQADVLRRVGLRTEELRFIFLLQALYAYQYAQTVAPDSDGVVFREAVRRRRRGGLRAGPALRDVVAEHGRCELSLLFCPLFCLVPREIRSEGGSGTCASCYTACRRDPGDYARDT